MPNSTTTEGLQYRATLRTILEKGLLVIQYRLLQGTTTETTREGVLTMKDIARIMTKDCVVYKIIEFGHNTYYEKGASSRISAIF